MQLFQKKIAILEEKKSRFEQFQMKQQKSHDDKLLDPETHMISTSKSSTDHESNTTEDPEYLETLSFQMKTKLIFKTPPAKQMSLVSFGSACDRTGVSDCAATIVASSLFYNKAGCFRTNPSLVLDRSKVRRSCQKHLSFL